MELYTILFLVIAVFLVFRLRSVFGRRTGTERPPVERPFNRDRAPGNSSPMASSDKVVPLPTRNQPRVVEMPRPEASDEASQIPLNGNSALTLALNQLMRADRNFTPDSFIAGAKLAYEMIVGAYAAGDRRSLKPLLSKDVFDGFDQAIGEREQAGQTVESSFVGLDKAEITEANLRGTNAQISVRFTAKMIQATRDKEGQLIDGDPTKIAEITDIWTFARDVASRDPNWRLVATGSP